MENIRLSIKAINALPKGFRIIAKGEDREGVDTIMVLYRCEVSGVPRKSDFAISDGKYMGDYV